MTSGVSVMAVLEVRQLGSVATHSVFPRVAAGMVPVGISCSRAIRRIKAVGR
jgi:hypothetical protein